MTDRNGTNGRRHRLRLGRRSVLAAVVAGAVLALTAAPASAAGNVPATAPLDLWGVDGTANTVVVSGSTVYVGGSFANAVRFTQSAPRQNVMALTLGTPKPVDSLSAFRDPNNGRSDQRRGAGARRRRQLAATSGATSRPSPTSCDPTSARVNRTTGAAGSRAGTSPPTRRCGTWCWSAPTLYLVGDFTKVNGTARKRAAAVSTGRPASWTPTSTRA